MKNPYQNRIYTIEAIDQTHLDPLQTKVFNLCFHRNHILIEKILFTQPKKKVIRKIMKNKIDNMVN